MRLSASIALLGLFAGACTQPADPSRLPPPPSSFTALDTDRDGDVDRAEWENHGDTVFERLDDNRDGRLSVVELQAGHGILDADGDGTLARSEIDIAALDPDGNGQIGPAEWDAAALTALLDEDGDGTVSRAELRAARAGTFRALDADGDSSIARVELARGRGFSLLRF